jgi:hypothetical protein
MASVISPHFDQSLYYTSPKAAASPVTLSLLDLHKVPLPVASLRFCRQKARAQKEITHSHARKIASL